MRYGYADALRLLPESLEREAELSARAAKNAEEIRLRVGFPVCVMAGAEEYITGKRCVTQKELEQVMEIATGASFYAADTIKQGYLTVEGGIRIGICGHGGISDGKIESLDCLSSLSLRIPAEHTGIAEPAAEKLFDNGAFKSTLILSAPGGGKTTFLRDLVRLLSDGHGDIKGVTVGLCDERGEIACMDRDGRANMNIGKRTDVMDGIPKASAAMMLLKTMSPKIIAMDEITTHHDIDAVSECFSCGVEIAATAHASSIADLSKRAVYRELIKTGVFRYAVLIRRNGRHRTYDVTDLEVYEWSR